MVGQRGLEEFLEGYEPSNGSRTLRPTVKGHVPTPAAVVDLMVEKLFDRRRPKPTDRVIDPGCGDGPFIEGVLRYCKARALDPPKIVGIEFDARHLARARPKFRGLRNVHLLEADYLAGDIEPAEFIIGNPPYVPITALDEAERERYRARFSAASGRFDLYLLFFEQSLRNLKPSGRLVFITPEKFEYVATAAPVRAMFGSVTVREVHHVDEETFPGLVTYPTITTVVKRPAPREHKTRIRSRDGESSDVELPRDGSSWNGALNGSRDRAGGLTLEDLCVRVSAGIATGSDEVFVHAESEVPRSLRRFGFPTISGRQLALVNGRIDTRDVMLVPYAEDGKLLPLDALGDLRTYFSRPDLQRKLQSRTCVTEGRKPWYAFHDNAPLEDILRPKILCKDIAPGPKFWAEREGRVVPRHSVYYLVPREGVDLNRLLTYLNGPEASSWLKAHCQRAANGFYRLQSAVLKKLPVPSGLAPDAYLRPIAA